MKLKPVFGDKERDNRDSRIEGATTVSRVENVIEDVDKKETHIPNMVNMVTKEEAEGMARQYANEASERAVNTALERYDSRRREEDNRRIKEIDAEREVEREAERKRDDEERERRRGRGRGRGRERDDKERDGKDDEDDDNIGIINPKVVKQLKDTVAVFTALKDLSSNPLQKTIEETVGGMAAGVVQKAFTPQHQEQKRDFVDIVLNSQFAAGLGAGIGQRAPELVETFGREKVDGWITGAIKGSGGKGGGMGGIGGLGGIPGTLPPGMPPGTPPGIGEQQQSEMELVLGLQPNNPEHVAAYAKSQGDIPVEVARKMLMIHQDAFINQLKTKGVDTSPYETRRSQESQGSQGLTYVSESGNVQEYRGPPPRISEDLMINTPITEDNRIGERQSAIEKENEENADYVRKLETQNVELHPEMERVKPKIVEPVTGINGEIANYLKNLSEQQKLSNDYMVGIKDEMSSLRQEVDILKRDRTMPDDMLKEKKVSNDVDNNKVDNQTTVMSMRTIKKGFSYVKPEV